VVATPHREDWYAVKRGAVERGPQYYEKHGSGFDRARRQVFSAFKASRAGVALHHVHYSNVGNTRSVKQCDGEYAGSNGKVGYIRLGN
jgi:hypothetical protein